MKKKLDVKDARAASQQICHIRGLLFSNKFSVAFFFSVMDLRPAWTSVKSLMLFIYKKDR